MFVQDWAHTLCYFRSRFAEVCCPQHPEAHLIEDYRAGDQICSECGLVVGDRWVWSAGMGQVRLWVNFLFLSCSLLLRGKSFKQVISMLMWVPFCHTMRRDILIMSNLSVNSPRVLPSGRLLQSWKVNTVLLPLASTPFWMTVSVRWIAVHIHVKFFGQMHFLLLDLAGLEITCDFRSNRHACVSYK